MVKFQLKNMCKFFIIFFFVFKANAMMVVAQKEEYRIQCYKTDIQLYYCGEKKGIQHPKMALLYSPVTTPMYTAFAHTYPDEVKVHRGVDIIGDPLILAAEGGEVIDVCKIACIGSYGRYVIIQHKQDMFTLYGHLDQVFVKKGQMVQRESSSEGTVIGQMGNTGLSFGTHLHFEVRSNASDAHHYRLDPIYFLDVYLNQCSNMFMLVDALQSSVHRYQQWYQVQSDGKIIANQHMI